MLFKFIILFMLFLILLSLSGGLFFLARDKSGTQRGVKALTLRVILSIGLFILLILGFLTGQLQPHGIMDQNQTQHQGHEVNEN